jgi:uncharacterized membrane protein YeaQ/YmgE (transglycosylase-associated protein family)
VTLDYPKEKVMGRRRGRIKNIVLGKVGGVVGTL